MLVLQTGRKSKMPTFDTSIHLCTGGFQPVQSAFERRKKSIQIGNKEIKGKIKLSDESWLFLFIISDYENKIYLVQKIWRSKKIDKEKQSIFILPRICLSKHFGIVLVCLGCYNKIPQIGQLINNTDLFSQFWRLEVIQI